MFPIVLTKEEASLLDFGAFEPVVVSVPRPIPELSSQQVTKISCGYSFSSAITAQGELFTWGFNEKGQLGLGHRINQEEPHRVKFPEDTFLTEVACGRQHTLVLSKKKQVFSFGLGVFGQLGHGKLKDQLLPAVIQSFIDRNIQIESIDCGALHSVAISDKGIPYSWGHGEYGQHGGLENWSDWNVGGDEAFEDPLAPNKTSERQQKEFFHSIPRILKSLDKYAVKSISCGDMHTICLTDQEAITWGWGANGCLGHGDKKFQIVPKSVDQLFAEDIFFASAGWKHSLFLKSGDDSTFAFDFKPLINSQKYYDLIFQVEKKTIFAHKCIVFARCPGLFREYQFMQRFHDPSDLESHAWPIKNVRYPLFIGFLHYLYTDHVKIAPHMLESLAQLATKWGVPRLEALARKSFEKSTSLIFQAETAEGKSIEVPPSAFAQEMFSQLKSGEGSDMTFDVHGQKFRAHKVVLTTRSAYFSTLFETSFKEREMSELSVDPSIKPNVFFAFLTYLYTNDETVINDQNALDLLHVADHFMMDDFLQIVEHFISQAIEPETILCILEHANHFGAHRLKNTILELLCTQKSLWDEVKDQQALCELSYNSPSLLRELDFTLSRAQIIKPGELVKRARTFPEPAFDSDLLPDTILPKSSKLEIRG